MAKKTTIQIAPELHQFPKNQAIRKDESYDEILKRLLKKLRGADTNKLTEKEA